MLKQYDFAFQSNELGKINSEFAVKIHGIIMHNMMQNDAQRLHISKYHPFSIYCVPSNEKNIVITRVSSLSKDGDSVINSAMKLKSVPLAGITPAKIIKYGELSSFEYNVISDCIRSNKLRLMFLTPSVFKIAGTETGFPDVTMHFISVIRKINEFEGENIDFDNFRKTFYKCKIKKWNFKEYRYNISGRNIPGMTGFMEIILPDNESEKNLLKKIFAYASFSGTGARTGMGMGGFFAEGIV